MRRKHPGIGRRRVAAIGVALAAVVAGCASQATRVTAQYVDPQLPAGAMRGAALLVVCDAPDTPARRVCEDRISEQLAALGARPLTDPGIASPTPGREAPALAYVAAARARGAQGVFNATLAADYSAAATAPLISIGVGGASGGSSGGVGGGIGFTLPAGPTGPGLSAIGSAVDSATGRVLWSARVSIPPGADSTAQIGEAARALVAEAGKSGLF